MTCGWLTLAEKIRRIGVVGAGAWGTALASVAARAGRETVLWAREPEVIKAINSDHENTPFLPGVTLDARISATDDLKTVAEADALLLVVPAQYTRAVLSELGPHLKPDTPAVLCSKGIEMASLKLMSDVLRETLPSALVAVLSGPSFAADVARDLPTAVTLACADRARGQALAQALGLPTFRPYLSGDVVGAQVGGAVKNVMAIACGIVEGQKLGDSARAALIARGFAEMARLGEKLGAAPETLAGLSGLGDLILTCTSHQSRNFSLGFALGSGQTMADYMADKTSVAEGAATSGAVEKLAAAHNIEMPICQAVAHIISERSDVSSVITALLSRPFTAE